MRLNHLDLQVSDVQQSVEFFETCFGLTLQSNRGSPALAILGDHNGFVLVLQRSSSGAPVYPEGFHLGFYVDSVEDVVGAQERARSMGVHASDLITNARGTMVYCRAMDGFPVEVNCRSATRPGVLRG